MRCLTLASEFLNYNCEVTFICADETPRELICAHGFEVIVLNSEWRDLDAECEKVQEVIRNEKDAIFFVDSYYVTQKYIDSIARYIKVCCLGIFDNLVSENLFALINYGVSADYDYYEQLYHNTKTKLLIGPSYTPIRAQFYREEVRVNLVVKNVLLTTGNADSNNFTQKVLQEIVASGLIESMQIHVIIGSMFKEIKKLRQEFSMYSNVLFIENVSDLSELMKDADLAVSAGGTTIFELAASAVPIVSFSLVAEQKNESEHMARLGAVCYCGAAYDNKEKCAKEIVSAIAEMQNDIETRLHLAETAHKLIDGRGSMRIVEELLKLGD